MTPDNFPEIGDTVQVLPSTTHPYGDRVGKVVGGGENGAGASVLYYVKLGQYYAWLWGSEMVVTHDARKFAVVELSSAELQMTVAALRQHRATVQEKVNALAADALLDKLNAHYEMRTRV